MQSLSLVMSECFVSGCGQGHVRNYYIVDLENFATASRHCRLYTQLDRSRFVYDTHNTMEATCSRHGWVHMFISHRPTLTLHSSNFITSICSGLVVQVFSALLHGNWQDFNWHDALRGPSAIAELLVLFSQICAPIHNEDFCAKKQTYSLVGSGLQTVLSHEILGSNNSRRLYDKRPVLGRSRRTADAKSFERRFSCEETVCRPHPTPQVFQTDTESRQTHSQCHRPCQLSEVTNAKLSWMKRMRFSFVGQMLDLLLLEIIPVVLIPHISNTFGVAVTSVKLKSDLNPFQIRIYLF